MVPHVDYVADEQTALITPEAFRVRLQQSGYGVQTEAVDDDVIELVMSEAVLTLFTEAGYVVEVRAEPAFVNDRKTQLLLELLESMGFLPADA